MNRVLKGDIVYSRSKTSLQSCKDGYLVIEEGRCRGVFEKLPEKYQEIPLEDYTGHLIIPGLVDLHLHAPQYTFRSLGMDLELLEWLNTHTFPQESRYQDLEYAKKAYEMFAEDMRRSETTRAVIFATIHPEATELLMDLMEESGICSYVGKVNMDRNSPDILCESSSYESLRATRQWLENTKDRYQRTKPILTPRFIPSCSDELMRGLGQLAREYGLPLQSHLSENKSEIAWVQELCPWSSCYGDAYDKAGAFGGEIKTIMAHCVWCPDEELELMKKRGVFVAHCPESNANLSSGIAPVRRYLDEGIPTGLGSDVAGGTVLSIFKAMELAVQTSKLRWRLCDSSLKPLTVPEVFYMATAGGGAFFGKVGSFEDGFEADALVLDESRVPTPLFAELSLEERLERMIYLGCEQDIIHKYVAGCQLF